MSNFKQGKILKDYYSERAAEYESIYNRPDKSRLKEQRLIARKIIQLFNRKYVLEIACGTGYWTKFLDQAYARVLATDISLEMLDLASSKGFNPTIQFVAADAYNPPISRPKFDGAMANFWFSHIPRDKTKSFLSTLHNRLNPEATVLIVDSVFKKNLGGELVKKGNRRDTYKKRTLLSGKKFSILKNYYSKSELENIFSEFGKKLQIIYLSNFWLATYKV